MRHPIPLVSALLAGTLALGVFCLMSAADTPEETTHKPDAQQPAGPAAGKAVATFASGCFWCTEAVFDELRGVHSVTSGYSGGDKTSANYKIVSTGQTEHAEAVQVVYDPSEVDYATLLEVFWKTHDPTTLNRQGADVGPQYRSAVFYHDEAQKRLAEEYKQKLDAEGVFNKPIVTQIVPFDAFYPAEDYHQNFFSLNPQQPYCRAVVGPKVEKFRKVFGDKLKNAPKKNSDASPTTGETKDQLRARLTDLQWRVTQEAGTERAFQNLYWNNPKAGDYRCVVCDELLFTSDNKFDSGCGWPSFTKPAEGDAVTEHVDTTHGMRRTEIRCTKCGAHLGHVFDDGPRDAGGLRYCLNSAAMQFEGNSQRKPAPEED